MGEEDEDLEGTSGLSWVVDPLDGTVNFLFGLPQWCVSVAVRDAGDTWPVRSTTPSERAVRATRGGEARIRSPAKRIVR